MMSQAQLMTAPAIQEERPLVRLRRVTKIFPPVRGGVPVHALGPIDLDLRTGEFFAVVGPSGCGKSTLFELIAGLSPATEGTIEFEGKPIAGNVPDGIGVVFQEDFLPALAHGARQHRTRPAQKPSRQSRARRQG